MLFRILHFIMGYYSICARGSFPERFFNLSSKNNLIIWGWRLQGQEMSFQVGLFGRKRAEGYLKKAGMTLVSCRMRGIPAGLFSYRKRYALFIGGALCIGVLSFLSTFIWAIEITPAKNVDTVLILQQLEKLGVKEGAKKSELDLDDIYQQMLLDIPQISWIAVNIKGTRAVVEVRARVMKPEIDDGIPSNIVAAADGQVVRMEVYQGKEIVKLGSAVQKGDLLVSGIMENQYTGEARMVPARAKVLALTYSRLQAEVPLKAEKIRYTGNKVIQHWIKIFNAEINISPFRKTNGENYDKMIEENQLHIGALYLPITWSTVTLRETQPFVIERTEEEAYALCEKELERQKELLSGEEYTVEETAFSILDGVAVLEEKVSCLQDIAMIEKMETGQ